MADDCAPFSAACLRSLGPSCAMKWRDLAPTEEDGVRFCAECAKTVTLARDEAHLGRLAAEGRCVAIFDEDNAYIGEARMPYHPHGTTRGGD